MLEHLLIGKGKVHQNKLSWAFQNSFVPRCLPKLYWRLDHFFGTVITVHVNLAKMRPWLGKAYTAPANRIVGGFVLTGSERPQTSNISISKPCQGDLVQVEA